MLRELGILPGFITGGQNLNNIIHTDDKALRSDTERKLQNVIKKYE